MSQDSVIHGLNPDLWVAPTGQIIQVSPSHISCVIAHPQAFSLTEARIKDTYDQHGEGLGQEGKAREALILEVLTRGWIRVRKYNNYWSITVHQLRGITKDLVKSLIKTLIEMGNMTATDDIHLLATETDHLDKFEASDIFESELEQSRTPTIPLIELGTTPTPTLVPATGGGCSMYETPIAREVDGIHLEGVLRLSISDLSLLLHTPWKINVYSSHIPYFGLGVSQFANSGHLTPKGEITVQDLFEEAIDLARSATEHRANFQAAYARFLQEIEPETSAVDQAKKELLETRARSRKQLKSGELDQKTFQQDIMPTATRKLTNAEAALIEAQNKAAESLGLDEIVPNHRYQDVAAFLADNP